MLQAIVFEQKSARLGALTFMAAVVSMTGLKRGFSIQEARSRPSRRMGKNRGNHMLKLRAFLLSVLAVGSFSQVAQAQSTGFMMNECSSVAQTYFREYTARTDMRYDGQRTDGTHAISGEIFLETRSEHFSCSYDRAGRQMVSFYAEGSAHNSYLPGGGGDPAGSNVVRVTGVAANDVLNVRSGPGTNYQVVGALANGDMVRRLNCQQQGSSSWCQIEMMTDMRERGWVNSRFLTEGQGAATQLPQPPRPTGGGDIMQVTGLSAGGLLNVRSGPGTSYSVVGALSNGTSVRNLGCQGSGNSAWCQIEMMTDMRERGWVAARFLTRGNAVQQPNRPPSTGTGSTTTERVQFAAGSTGAELSGTLRPGATKRYIVNARNGQMLYFRLASNASGLSWALRNPDGSLMDEGAPSREYRGSLWQTGDHVAEVINRSGRTQSYNVIFGIQ